MNINLYDCKYSQSRRPIVQHQQIYLCQQACSFRVAGDFVEYKSYSLSIRAPPSRKKSRQVSFFQDLNSSIERSHSLATHIMNFFIYFYCVRYGWSCLFLRSSWSYLLIVENHTSDKNLNKKGHLHSKKGNHLTFYMLLHSIEPMTPNIHCKQTLDAVLIEESAFWVFKLRIKGIKQHNT